jgi:hypothetical protein
MAGALRSTFGVCANEWSPSDGRVISLDHGCGAHSETDVDQPEPTPIGEPIVDEFAVDLEAAPVREQPEEQPDDQPEGRADAPAETQSEVVDEAEPEGVAEVEPESGVAHEAQTEAPVEEHHGSDDPVTD